jgi:hypothetical protein
MGREDGSCRVPTAFATLSQRFQLLIDFTHSPTLNLPSIQSPTILGIGIYPLFSFATLALEPTALAPASPRVGRKEVRSEGELYQQPLTLITAL